MKLCWILLLVLPLIWGQSTDEKDEQTEYFYETIKETLEKLKIVENKNDSLKKRITELEEQLKKLGSGSGSAAPQRASCPLNVGINTVCNATLSPKGCYCVIYKNSKWTEAENLCLQKGARLVSIETAEENAAIKKLYSTQENFERNGGAGTRLWTSGSDFKENNRWFWTTTGQPITGFTDWWPGEPSPQYVGEDYLDLWISSDKSGWNDSPNDPGEFGWDVFPLCEL